MKNLNAYQLKIIALTAMFFDHAITLVPITSNAVFALVNGVHMVGRITIPIMCYFIAEGYHYTHSTKKYLQRLFVFMLISQIPFYLFRLNSVPQSFKEFLTGFSYLNVIYTLMMGLLALIAAKSARTNIFVKTFVIFIILLLTTHCDWGIYGVLWILVFGLFRGDFKKQAFAFSCIALYRCIKIAVSGNFINSAIQSCVMLALPLLYCYNGERGKKLQYGFYIFYPAHLFLIGLINILK